jgi:molecular chaperone GrpE
MRPEEESQGPVIRDRRRIDPVTGQVRNTGEAGPQRGSASAGGQSKPGKHSVSTPGGAGARQGADPDQSPAGATATAGRKPSGAPGSASTGSGAPEAGESGSGGAADPAMAQVVTLLSERTADLQRERADYAN